MDRNYTITVCGASRVGKSTLINAMVGRQVATTNSSLRSCTHKITEYVLERNVSNTDPSSNYTITLWDTPGIESWDEVDVRAYFVRVTHETKPVCVIYCVSPNSFIDKQRVKEFVETCMHKNIFIALVCTNMYAGNRRAVVMQEFIDILTSINPSFEQYPDGDVCYFDKKALCTMVNSKPYVDEDFGVRKEPSGVNELILGITRCLSGEMQLPMLQSASQNRSFRESISSHSLRSILQRSATASSSIVENRAFSILRYLHSIYHRSES